MGMRRFIHLVESLNTVLPYEWEHRTWNYSNATFQAGDKLYKVAFKHKDILSGDRDLYACEFYTTGPDGKNTVGLIGTGNEFAVISTSMAVMRDFLEHDKPAVLGFSAEGASRIRLYKTIAQKLGVTVPGYSHIIGDGTMKANFYLKKTD